MVNGGEGDTGGDSDTDNGNDVDSDTGNGNTNESDGDTDIDAGDDADVDTGVVEDAGNGSEGDTTDVGVGSVVLERLHSVRAQSRCDDTDVHASICCAWRMRCLGCVLR